MLRSPRLMRTAIGLLAMSPMLATPVTRYLGCAEKPNSEVRNPIFARN
jgi:hypothetical protein